MIFSAVIFGLLIGTQAQYASLYEPSPRFVMSAACVQPPCELAPPPPPQMAPPQELVPPPPAPPVPAMLPPSPTYNPYGPCANPPCMMEPEPMLPPPPAPAQAAPQPYYFPCATPPCYYPTPAPASVYQPEPVPAPQPAPQPELVPAPYYAEPVPAPQFVPAAPACAQPPCYYYQQHMMSQPSSAPVSYSTQACVIPPCSPVREPVYLCQTPPCYATPQTTQPFYNSYAASSSVAYSPYGPVAQTIRSVPAYAPFSRTAYFIGSNKKKNIKKED